MIKKTLKIYSKEDVFKSTLSYFKGDELATDVWIKKYCLKDENNLYELNPDDMHRRIAKELARIEAKYKNPLTEEQIYETLKNFNRIIPQGSPMSGIGNDFQVVSIGNCFVIGNYDDGDSYGGILNIDEEQVQLMKRRAGVGHDLSHIRPVGSPVKNSAITSTGIVPFMERYSNSTKEVAQDGRRGALMLSVSIKHPDAEAFIDAKMIPDKITGANVSVKITDEFMNSVINNTSYQQQYPVDTKHPKFVKDINPKKLWDKIIFNAWKSAEPGILFWDKIISESIPACYGEEWIERSTNPCGELPLPPNDSCRLMAMNLFGYVVNPFTDESYFNWDLFKSDVEIAMRYMDDIVDLELEKIDKILAKIDSDPECDKLKRVERELWTNIKRKAELGRRTGLGVTAEGDMLAALGLTYGGDDGIDFSEKVHKTLKLSAYRSSVIMAKERGTFPLYNTEKENDNPFLLRIKEEDINLYTEMQKFGRRNIALLTIAPTGTASLMTQTTSGIEPVFLPVYKRRRKINSQEKNTRIDFTDSEGVTWAEYLVFHHKFKQWLEINGYDVDVVKTMSEIQVDEIVKKSPYYKATSNDINWVNKVIMQGRIQKHVDHSISITTNIPSDATVELVDEIYRTAWEVGCKGMTIYRDGSRSGVLVDQNETKQKNVENNVPKRLKRLKGDIHKFQNNLEKWIGVVGLKDGRPYEIFTGKLENGLSNLPNNVKTCEIVKNIVEDENGLRKKRYDIEYVDSNGIKQTHCGLNHAFNKEFWNYAKLISAVLRHGMPLIHVFELVDSLNLDSDHLNTWKNGVARVIKRYIEDGKKSKGYCPECGGTDFVFQEGCLKCSTCSWTKCG